MANITNADETTYKIIHFYAPHLRVTIMPNYIFSNTGMGGFNNPPTHPEHSMCVKWGDDSCSLSHASDPVSYMPKSVQEQAKRILDTWQAPPLDTPAIQAWIRKLLRYFQHCYKGDCREPYCWYAPNLKIDSEIDPMTVIDEHAGIHAIRRFYPEFMPTLQHFQDLT